MTQTATRVCQTYPTGFARAGTLHGTTLQDAIAKFDASWTDAHIPRTPAPLRFHHVVAFYWQDGTIATPRSVWTSRNRIVPLPRS